LGHRRERVLRTGLVKSFTEVSLDIFDLLTTHMAQHEVGAEHQAARVKDVLVRGSVAILAHNDTIFVYKNLVKFDENSLTFVLNGV